MQERLATFLSYLFHPLFIPLYGLVLLFNTGLYISFALSGALINIIYLIVFFNTIFLPGLLIFILYKSGYLTSLMAENQQQRHILYITMIIFYFATYKLFQNFPTLPELLSSFILGATFAILILFIANFFIKISAHMVGIGGIIGMLYLVSDLFLESYSQFLIPIIIVAGLLGYSRLKLNAHRPFEIYSGLLIGFCGEYFSFYYSLFF